MQLPVVYVNGISGQDLLCSPTHTGFKKLYENADAIPPFFAASCELALGFIPVLGMTDDCPIRCCFSFVFRVV